jgi:FPC/CPF motif-containing protein YcgG
MRAISETNRNRYSGRASPQKQFAAFIAEPAFPCLGAKSTFNSDSYKVKVYKKLADPSCSSRLARDLERFQFSEIRRGSDYATFVAFFREPRNVSELKFETLLWSQLRLLHHIDAKTYGWDSSVASDLQDPHFSFSFAGKALYVIGMHPNSSRLARRFSWLTLVFNPHEQFERMRRDGKWRRMQEAIRQRDAALQGNVNPMLSDFGETSEARQYSGRVVTEDWHPHFQPKDSASVSRCPFAH